MEKRKYGNGEKKEVIGGERGDERLRLVDRKATEKPRFYEMLNFWGSCTHLLADQHQI